MLQLFVFEFSVYSFSVVTWCAACHRIPQTPPEPRERAACLSGKYSIVHDVIQMQTIQSWLVLSLSTSHLMHSLANVSYLSQPLVLTQDPTPSTPGPSLQGRTSSAATTDLNINDTSQSVHDIWSRACE